MADLEVAIAARIAAHGLNGLAGTPPRAYNIKAPQQALLPLVVFAELTVVRRHAMGLDVGVLETPVRFTTRAATLDAARAVNAELNGLFSRWRGDGSGVTVQDVLIEGTTPDFNPDLDSFEVETDMTFWTVGL